MEKYKFERKIGRGACGIANLYTVKETSQLVVIKSVNNPFRNGENDMTPEEKQCLREVDIMSTLSHPNIVKFYEYLIIGDEMNIVMEYCNSGDLAVMIHHARQKHEMFSEKQIMFWFIQILLAVGYLHELRIIHRDIKPSNIFLTVNHKVIKLGDFGVTRKLGSSTEYAATVIGTPLYMAPELILSEPYSTKSDVWSLGILLYELCELNTPFSGASILQISTDIINGQVPPLTPNKYNEDMYSLISTMLNKDPETRVSILTIMTCPLITTYLYEFIKEYGNDEILKSIGMVNNINEELLSSVEEENTTNTDNTVAVNSYEKGLLESCCKLCIPFLITPNSSFDVSNSFNPNTSSADIGSLDESNASEIGKDMFLKSQDPKSSNESTPNQTYNNNSGSNSNRISLVKKLSIIDPDNIIKPRRKSNSKSPPQNQQLKQKHNQNNDNDTTEQLVMSDNSNNNSNSNTMIIYNNKIIDSDSPLSPVQQQQQMQTQQIHQFNSPQISVKENEMKEEEKQEVKEDRVVLKEEKIKDKEVEEEEEVIEVEVEVYNDKEKEKEKDKTIEEEGKCECKSEDILSPHSPLKQRDASSSVISPRPMNFKSPTASNNKSKSSPISDEHKSTYQTGIKPNIENESKVLDNPVEISNIEEKKIEDEVKIDLPLSQYDDILSAREKQKQKQPTIKTDEELLIEKQQRIERRRKRRLQKQNRRSEESKLDNDLNENDDDDDLDSALLSPNIQSPSYPIQLLKQQQQQLSSPSSTSSPLTTVDKPSPIKSPLIEMMKKNQLISDYNLHNNSNSNSNSDNNSTKTPSPNDISPRKLNPIKHLSPRSNYNITPITNHLGSSPYSNLSPTRQLQQQQQQPIQQEPPPPPPQPSSYLSSNGSLSMYKSPPSNQRHVQSYHSTPSHLPSLQSTPLSIQSSKSSRSLLHHQQQKQQQQQQQQPPDYYYENKKKKSSPIKSSEEMMIRGNPLKGVHNSNSSDNDNSKMENNYGSENIIDTENERRFNEEIFYMNNKKPLKKTNSFNDYKKKKQRDKNRPYSAPFEAVTAINQIRIEARQVISSLGQR